MRYLVCCLMLAACTGDSSPAETPDMCHDIVEQQTFLVPYAFDVGTETETYAMNNGCSYIRITNYVFGTDSSGGAGAGGSAPDPLHCDVDGCNPAPDTRMRYTDPAEYMNSNMMMNGGH